MSKRTLFDVLTQGLQSGALAPLTVHRTEPRISSVGGLSEEKAKEYLDQRKRFDSTKQGGTAARSPRLTGRGL